MVGRDPSGTLEPLAELTAPCDCREYALSLQSKPASASAQAVTGGLENHKGEAGRRVRRFQRAWRKGAMSSNNVGEHPTVGNPPGPVREVPVDWEALEDAFENNAPEVHSYLHLTTGEDLRVVDGVADPQMHVR